MWLCNFRKGKRTHDKLWDLIPRVITKSLQQQQQQQQQQQHLQHLNEIESIVNWFRSNIYTRVLLLASLSTQTIIFY